MPPEDAVRIEARDLDDPVARALERRCSDDIAERYGSDESEPPIEAAPFRPPHGTFLVAFAGDEAVGCAGLRPIGEGRAELKRMYVTPEARRRGVARALLRAIEGAAEWAGYEELWLETGTAQPEAIELYAADGYRPIDGYGQYKDYPNSRSFGRALSPRR